MSRDDSSNAGTPRPPGAPRSLTDDDITTVRLDRRSFLARAAVTSSLALGTVLATGCGDDNDGNGSDHCDSDIGVTDSDAGANADPAGQGADSCDSD